MSNASNLMQLPRNVPGLVGVFSDKLELFTVVKESTNRPQDSSQEIQKSLIAQFGYRFANPNSWSVPMGYQAFIRVRIGKESGLGIKLFSEAEPKLRKKIMSYTELDDNWDRDGAKAPSSDAATDTMSFLDNRPTDIPLPFPECGTEGDIGLYWDNGHANVFTEVSFEGDGTYAYFSVHGVPGAIIEKCGADGIDVREPWPSMMLKILRKIKSA